MPHQIGHLTNPKPDDPTIGDKDEAFRKAVEGSSDDSVWGVWTSQQERSELIAIVYMQDIFT